MLGGLPNPKLCPYVSSLARRTVPRILLTSQVSCMNSCQNTLFRCRAESSLRRHLELRTSIYLLAMWHLHEIAVCVRRPIYDRLVLVEV